MPALSTHERHVFLLRVTQSGQWDRTLTAATDWLAEEPDNPQPHRFAAQALVNLGRAPDAAPHLERVLAASPDDAFAHRLMAIVHSAQKNHRAADDAIRKAIELNPEDARNWHQLALMCHRQRDRKTALTAATKARELAPTNADILNLYALCADERGSGPTRLLAALEADPENAPAHNNLGVHYLNAGKDNARAEACFRRALTIDPTLKVARRNLFLVIKRRDPVYRIMRAPLDLLLDFRNAVVADHKRNYARVALALVLWLLLVRFFVIGIALWFGLVWPMTKVYEFLVLGELKRKAGEVGAARGGLFGYRRWPLRVRLSIFGAVLLGFWSAVVLVFIGRNHLSAQLHDRLLIIGGFLLIAVAIGFMTRWTYLLFRGARSHFRAWRRRRMLRGLTNLEK